jgi:hypothetical protein
MEGMGINVPLEDTKFTVNEIGEFIYHHTGRLPTRFEGFRITWNLDEEGNRTIHFKVGENLHLGLPASPHYKEDPKELCQLWIDNPYLLAEQDTHRVIALGLTAMYKKKIAALWGKVN